jgi:demethylmenaquinone methyltransferase / 2-methoxy-6-polyprenyl-1,4-benzoquinol methylase
LRAAIDQGKLRAVYDRVAGRYDLQHSFFTAGADQRGRQVLVREAVRPGDNVLDCGAGTGSTALLAVDKVGLSGKVVLFDISEGMLDVASARIARSNGRDRTEFKIGDMLDLPFADNQFDVVLSTYSLCPLGDPAKGAMELYRVARPGGHIGIAHSTEPGNPLVRWLADKVESLVWHLPSISLGCRSVSVLPTLERLGGQLVFNKRIGVPLWPFLVFVMQKPAD